MNKKIVKMRRVTEYETSWQDFAWVIWFLITYTFGVGLCIYFLGMVGALVMFVIATSVLFIVREVLSNTYYEVIEDGKRINEGLHCRVRRHPSS